jgi:hypothetical protein
MVVTDRKGPDVRLPARDTAQAIPHDLVHAAVETALGIADGFWGAVAEGATFEGFEPVQPSRHRRAGLKVLRRKGDAVMAAELKVGLAYRIWQGLPVEGRGMPRLVSLESAEVQRAVTALDEARAAWSSLRDGEHMTWTWCARP